VFNDILVNAISPLAPAIWLNLSGLYPSQLNAALMSLPEVVKTVEPPVYKSKYTAILYCFNVVVYSAVLAVYVFLK
jgi:hypothetical protein